MIEDNKRNDKGSEYWRNNQRYLMVADGLKGLQEKEELRMT